MVVKIQFKITESLLEKAVRHCIYFGKNPNRKNVLESIKSSVHSAGNNILKFPEYWGDDILMLNYPQEKIDKIVNSLSHLVE